MFAKLKHAQKTQARQNGEEAQTAQNLIALWFGTLPSAFFH
jgi:hypothetical protein